MIEDPEKSSWLRTLAGAGAGAGALALIRQLISTWRAPKEKADAHSKDLLDVANAQLAAAYARIEKLQAERDQREEACEKRVQAHRDRAHKLANDNMKLKGRLIEHGCDPDEEP